MILVFGFVLVRDDFDNEHAFDGAKEDFKVVTVTDVVAPVLFRCARGFAEL